MRSAGISLALPSFIEHRLKEASMSATFTQSVFARSSLSAFQRQLHSTSTAKTIRLEKAPLIHLSAVLAWGCFATGLVVAQLINPGVAHDLSSGGTGAIVIATAFAAFMLMISLIQRHMGTALTASQTLTPSKLCTSGIFKYSRNPIYLAFILPLAAISVFSIFAAFVSIICYVTTMTFFVIRNEEQGLSTLFGVDYHAYLASTPRWLGV
jgi:protein-S-isoprenylcysteine O-methyltransferase Ste14